MQRWDLFTQQTYIFECTFCWFLRFLYPFLPLQPLARASPCPHVAHRAGRNGRRKTCSPGCLPTGRCREKLAPTHIMNNIRWIEALSLYDGKSTIFCGSSVALAPNPLNIQANKNAQEPYGARWPVLLHCRLFQPRPLPKGTLTNGSKQF